MVVQDRADEVLGILYANPDKIDRRLLAKYKLRAELFRLDKAQEYLFRLINLASYANKQVNEAFIDAFGVKEKLSKDLVEEIKFALDRAKEQDTNIVNLQDKITIFKSELKSYNLRATLLETNDLLNKGEKSVDDILIHIRESLLEITQDDEVSQLSSTRGYTTQFIQEYQQELDASNLQYGFKPIDDTIKYILPGELHVIAGASNEGKSIILMNVLYYNLVYKKKNCLWASLEMGKTQCLYRLISLHSTHPKFSYNIPHEKIKKKELSATEESQFFEVLQDLFENPDYGELFFTEGVSTAQELFDEAEDINRFCPLDGIFLDYLSLLSGNGSTEQAVIASNFKMIKHKALTFANNKKIPVITVHQISEQAKEKAEDTGKYEFNFLSDTSEARKSADCTIWILRTAAHRESHEVGVGFNKVRDGAFPPNFSLFEDFEHAKAQAIDATIE